MPKKRGHGEASYRERVINGHKYIEGRIMINGKSYSRYAKMKPECRAKIDKLRFHGAEKKSDEYTVKEWLEKWLEEEVRPQRREKTYIDYKIVIYKHLVPILGSIFLSELSRDDIQKFVNKKQKEKLSSRSIRIFYTVLSTALKLAERDEIIEKNPCRYISLPEKEKAKRTWFSIENMSQFLAIDTLTDTAGNSLKFSALTGLRRGELLALKWSDIDLKRKTLNVSSSLTYTEKGFVLSKTKTNESIREIPLNDIALQILTDQRTLTGNFKLVFSNRRGKILSPSTLRSTLSKLITTYKLPSIRIHDLRHSFASILHEANVDHKTIQSLLGHSNIQTTLNIYVHSDKENKKRATEKISSLLKNN